MRMEVQRGAIHAALIQSSGGDVSAVEAVEPSQDWWLPSLVVPETEARVVVVNPSPVPVDITIDVYAAGTTTEAVYQGSIEARSQIDIPIIDLVDGPAGLRISSDGPVVAGLVVDGETARAATPGTTLSTEWVVAGSGSLDSRVWVFNPGEVEAELILQPLAPDSAAQAATVPPDAAVVIRVQQGGAGYLVRSTSEISVLWSGHQGGLALASAWPVASVGE
jgi:hypothetical protein